MIYALDSNSSKVHILEAVKTEVYYCQKCNDRVVPHQGRKMPWHFVYKSDPNCIVTTGRSKGCIFDISNIQNKACKSIDICERNCHIK